MQHLDEGTIHAWLDGQLPPGEAESVELHVAECRPCADAVAEARGLIAASSRILMSLDGVPRDVAPKQAVSDAGSDVASGSPAPRSPMIVSEGSVVRPISPAVASGAGGTASTSAARRARRRWVSGPSLAAAATILVAVGTFAVVQGGGGRGPEQAAFDAAASAVGPFADSASPALERAAP